MKKKVCIQNIHPICQASDSGLAECVCWCAECKEYSQNQPVRAFIPVGA